MTPTFDLNGAIILGLLLKLFLKHKTENIASFIFICHYFFNYMTFVENIINSYQGGQYSPTVHITPNSPTCTFPNCNFEDSDHFHIKVCLSSGKLLKTV